MIGEEDESKAKKTPPEEVILLDGHTVILHYAEKIHPQGFGECPGHIIQSENNSDKKPDFLQSGRKCEIIIV